jgi:type IV secretion system protein VirB10
MTNTEASAPTVDSAHLTGPFRATPPSPKRLSRKALLAGVAAAGLIIALALINGLSERPDRTEAATQNAVAAASGPPESIAQAAAEYDTTDLTRMTPDPSSAEHAVSDEIVPPQGEMWSRMRSSGTAETSGAPSMAPNAPDPEAVARTSPILFTSARETEGAEDDEGTLDARLASPRSPYTLQAGQVIPAALITALNSDAPGRVIAQVTAPIYDSLTGDHLLIPQGARLLGRYNNGVRYGDNRVVLAWDRLILPSGASINLQEMEASDATGASGVRDRVDNHLDRLAAAIALSSIISVGANEAESDDEHGFGQSLGDAAAQQAAQTGARIVDRELSVRPTLRVRAGASVRVLVSRDIVLRPYRQ